LTHYFQAFPKDTPKKLSKAELNSSVEFSRGLPPSSSETKVVTLPNGMKPRVPERKQVAGKWMVYSSSTMIRIAGKHGLAKEDWICVSCEHDRIIKRICDLWKV
jgi:hypothetical protein